MISNSFIVFFSILFLATITPGPSMLLAVNHGARHGIAKTIYSGLGNLTGNLLMATVSLLGLGIILITSGVVFNVVKWFGVAYLFIIGIKMIIEPVETDEQNNNFAKSTAKTKKLKLFSDGFVIAIGNPKGILFFTALFPQFINIKNTSGTELTLFFLTLGCVAFGCFMLYAGFGVRLNRLFRLKSFRKLFNRISGSIMIGFGLTMAFTNKIVER